MYRREVFCNGVDAQKEHLHGNAPNNPEKSNNLEVQTFRVRQPRHIYILLGHKLEIHNKVKCAYVKKDVCTLDHTFWTFLQTLHCWET